MRTLKKIDAEIFEKAKKRAEEPNLVLTPQEVVNLYSEMAFGDKYREMYAILKDVESYLLRVLDNPEERAELLKRIKAV